MIYYVQIGNKLPQRIPEEHAHDFYQMWFGNELGQERFDDGTHVTCPNYPQMWMWGEEGTDAVVFKKVLTGDVADGLFDIDELIG